MSYISAHTSCPLLPSHCMTSANGTENMFVLEKGIPQGSSISGLLFNAIMLPLCRKFGNNFLNYADDMKLIFSYKEQQSTSAEIMLNSQLGYIEKYLKVFDLKINSNKSGYVIFKLKGTVANLRLSTSEGMI